MGFTSKERFPRIKQNSKFGHWIAISFRFKGSRYENWNLIRTCFDQVIYPESGQGYQSKFNKKRPVKTGPLTSGTFLLLHQVNLHEIKMISRSGRVVMKELKPRVAFKSK